MRGLTIIVADANELRFRSALGLALSYSALGGAVQLFLDTAAVSLLRLPIVGAEDRAQIAAGLPSLAGLASETIEADVRITLCQAGLAMAQASAADFDPRVEFGGLIGVLAKLGDNRLVIA